MKISIPAVLASLVLCIINAKAEVFNVSNLNDNGPGSLRQAVSAANSTDSEDSIVFDLQAFGSASRTIFLAGGQIGITQPLKIFGTGRDRLTISGSDLFRVFFISNSAPVSISNLTISNGKAGEGTSFSNYGGGVFVASGTLNLSDSRVTGSRGEQAGGLFNNQGTVSLVNVILENNQALGGRNDGSYGGAVFNQGTITIVDSILRNNLANGGNVSTSGLAGGGIGGAILNSGNLTIKNSLISNNRAIGGTHVSSWGGNGGGGGIYSSGTLNISNSTFEGNSAGGGDGFNTFDGNGSGGALVSLGTSSIVNSTISNNSSTAASGGFARGGGIWDSGNSSGIIVNTTLTGNTSAQGGGIFFYSSGMSVRNTIIAQNTANTGKDSYGGCISLGNNLVGTWIEAYCFVNGVNGDISGTDSAPVLAGLLSLADNGGSWRTHALSTGSPAINAGNNCVLLTIGSGGCVTSALSTDQRGYARRSPAAVAVDIGAVEFGADFTSPTAPSAPDLKPEFDGGISNSDNLTNSRTPTFDLAGIPTEGAVVELLRDGSVVASLYSTSATSVFMADSPLSDGVFNYSSRLVFNGIAGPASPPIAVTFDTVRPTVQINQDVGQQDPTPLGTVRYSVVFSKPVFGFDGSDILLAGSTANVASATKTLSGTAPQYGLEVAGIISDGQFVRASIPENSATDDAGNVNPASTSTDNTITVDNVRPAVSINQADGQTDPASSQPIRFTVVLSEPVTGFQPSDISFGGSTANTSVATTALNGSGLVFQVSVENVISSGVLTVSIPANSFQDAIGNQNLASTSSDNVVVVNVPAFASLAGRVTDEFGRGVAFARVVVMGSSSAEYYAIANPFGYYRFAEIPTGNISVQASRKAKEGTTYSFYLTGNRSDLDFILRYAH